MPQHICATVVRDMFLASTSTMAHALHLEGALLFDKLANENA